MATIMLKVLLLIFLSLSSLSYCQEVQPGLRVGIRDTAIEAFEEHFIPLLLKNLTNIPLKDANLTNHVDFLGDILLGLNNMKVRFGSITPEKLKVGFNNNIINVTIEDFSINIDFGYLIQSNFYNNKGTGSAGITNLTFVLGNKVFGIPNEVSKQKYGRDVLGPALNIDNLNITSLTVDVKFDNDQPLERLIKFFVDNLNLIFQKQVKYILNETFIPVANDYLNNTFKNLYLTEQIPGTEIYVDYSLIESPKIVNNSLEVSFNATLFSNKSVFSASNVSVIPHITNSSKQIEIFLNQYVVDSLLISLQETNVLNFYIRGDSLNSSSPISLNTGSIGLFISALSDKYGNNKTIDIKCNSTKVPSLTLLTNKSSAVFYPTCEFIVNVNSTYQETAFTVGLEVNGELKLILEKGFLKGEIKNLSIGSLKILQTNIGEIDENKLKNFFNFSFGLGLPIINSLVFKNTGIKLPSVQGISFGETDLSINPGYIQLDMDPLFEQNITRSRNLR